MSSLTPNILLAPGDPMVRSKVATWCQHAGWQVQIHTDAAAALKAFQRTDFDVIIVDHELPQVAEASFFGCVQNGRPGQPVLLLAKSKPGNPPTALGPAVEVMQFNPEDSDWLEQTMKTARRLYEMKIRELLLQSGCEESAVTSEARCFNFASADLIGLKLLAPFVAKLCRRGQLTNMGRQSLELAFQEALANAIEHGNLELDSSWKDDLDAEGLDKFSRVKAERLRVAEYANRRVYVSAAYDDSAYILKVRDEGPGFSPENFAKFIANSQKPELSGRGLHLIRQSVDEVKHSEGGREITLIRWLDKA